MDYLGYIFFAIIATIVGAVPLGLVNLTVMDIAYQNGSKKAMNIAHGAAWVEVLFGLIAIVFGSLLSYYTSNITAVKYISVLLPIGIGVFFILKKSKSKRVSSSNGTSFLKGVFLNLISVQVLLYWLVAIAYANSIFNMQYTPLTILLFAIGIWLGKMGVLWLYAFYSYKIFSKFTPISRNINRIIGGILVLTALVQFIK